MKKFENYRSNLAVLSKADQEDLNNSFIISGIIDKFSLQFELAWKVLKELLRYEGSSAAGSGSPREILKAAYGVFDFLEESAFLHCRWHQRWMFDQQSRPSHFPYPFLSSDSIAEILHSHNTQGYEQCL